MLNDRITGVTISEPTAERVRAVAERMNYRPNRSALSLRTSKTFTVGVIVLDVAQPFSSEFLRVINAVCRSRGYSMLVGHAEDQPEASRELLDILSPDQVDGILLLGDVLPLALSQTDMASFVQEHRHVVTVASRPRHGGEVAITVDNARGVSLALEHLAGLGHRHIAYVGATQPPLSWEVEERYSAYVRFMDQHGLPWSADSTAAVRGRQSSRGT